MTTVELIDSHVHFWPAPQLHYDWLAAAPAIAAPHGPGEYAADSAAAREWGLRLRGVVFVEAGRAPGQGLAEAKWAAGLRGTPPTLGIIAHAPLELGAAARPSLALLAKMHRVVGIRRNYQDEPPGFASQPAFIRGLRALADFRFTHDLCLRWQQLEETRDLVARCPQVQFVLNHCAKPAIDDAARPPAANARWRAGMRALAALPNLVCKLSGLVTEANHQGWHWHDLQPYVEYALEIFGAERLLFGSDWPVVKLAGGWRRWLAAARELLAPLSAFEQEAIFAKNALRVYHLDEPAPDW